MTKEVTPALPAPDESEGPGKGRLARVSAVPGLLGEGIKKTQRRVQELLDFYLTSANQIGVFAFCLLNQEELTRMKGEAIKLVSGLPGIGRSLESLVVSGADKITNLTNHFPQAITRGIEAVFWAWFVSKIVDLGRQSEFWPANLAAGVFSGAVLYNLATRDGPELFYQMTQWPIVGGLLEAPYHQVYQLNHTQWPLALALGTFFLTGGFRGLKGLLGFSQRFSTWSN